MNRRSFLGGALAAPFICRRPGLLMPIKARPKILTVKFNARPVYIIELPRNWGKSEMLRPGLFFRDIPVELPS